MHRTHTVIAMHDRLTVGAVWLISTNNLNKSVDYGLLWLVCGNHCLIDRNCIWNWGKGNEIHELTLFLVKHTQFLLFGDECG